MTRCRVDLPFVNWHNKNSEFAALFERGCTCEDVALANREFMYKCFDVSPPLPSQVQIVFFCAFAFVAALSILANFIVIWIILWHPVMRKRRTNKYVLNLAFRYDLCLTFFNSIPLGIANLLEYWPFPCSTCPLLQMLGVVPFSTSIYTMCLISADRYKAILYPLHARYKNHKFMRLSLALVWILGIVFAVPQLLIYECFQEVAAIGIKGGQRQLLTEFQSFCEPGSDEANKIYSLTLLVLQFLVPICILFFTYGRIALELCQPTPEQSLSNSIMRAKQRTAKLFAILVFSFMALWLPYELAYVVPQGLLLRAGIFSKVLVNATFLLAMAATLVSPIIYYHMSERFRVGFRYALTRCIFWRAGHIAREYKEAFALN